MRIVLCILILFLNTHLSFTQNKAKIDSLKSELNRSIIDSSQIDILNELSHEYGYIDFDSSLVYATRAISYSNSIEYTSGRALAYNFKGVAYYALGQYELTLKYYLKSLDAWTALGNKLGMAAILNEIGTFQKKHGDIEEAKRSIERALILARESGDNKEIGNTLNNLGIVFEVKGDLDSALFYYRNSTIYKKAANDIRGLTYNMNNIASLYTTQGKYDSALVYFQEALEIRKGLGMESSVAITYINIAELYVEQGNTYDDRGSYEHALYYIKQCQEIAKKTKYTNLLMHTYFLNSKATEKLENYKEAIKSFKLYSQLKDSLFNEEKSKGIGKIEAKHEYEMAELKRKQDEEERSRQLQLAVSRRNQLQYSGIVLVLVGLFIGIFLFAHRFRKVKEYKTFRQYTKIVEAALFISFLIFFEFILVILDPYIEQVTGGAPLWKLGFNALLAGVIFPIHSFLESNLKGQVIKTERKKWVAEAIKGKNLLVIIGLGLVLGLNTSTTLSTGFDASTSPSTGSSKIDSLKTILTQSTKDTTRINTLLKIGDHLIYTELDTALMYYKEALSIALEIDNKELMQGCYNSIGIIYWNKSDYPQALQYYNQSLEINEQLKDKKAIANNYNNIGVIYFNQSSYPQALSYYFKCLKICEELGNKQDMAGSYNNIGVIYYNQSSYPQALTYHFKSLKIEEEQGNKQGMADSYNNIGLIYYNQSLFPRALTYYFKCLKICEEQGNKQGMAGSYGNIGILCTSLYEQGVASAEVLANEDRLGRVGVWAALTPKKLLDTAMYYQQKAFSINKELGLEYGMTFSLCGIASIHYQKGEYSHALEYYQHAVLVADSIGALKRESKAHSGLSTCYEKLNNHKFALDHYKIYSTLKDSVFNEEKSKDLGKLEAKHEFEMAEMKKKQEEEERSKQLEVAVSRRNQLQYSGILIVIFILFGSLFLLGKHSIPNWLVELSVFIPFLILFEFLLVLLDPSIESWAGSEPAFKLMFNAGLAGLMFPLHQFFERKLKKRIVKSQRNKIKKRMEQFKKDVEEL